MKKLILHIYNTFFNKDNNILYKYIKINDSNNYSYLYRLNNEIYYTHKLENNIKYKIIKINEPFELIYELINLLDNFSYLIYKDDLDICTFISDISIPSLLLRTDNFRGFKLLNLINEKEIYKNDLNTIINYIKIIKDILINNYYIINDIKKILINIKDIDEYIYYYIIALFYYIILTYIPYYEIKFKKTLNILNINIPNLFRNDGYNHHKIINYFTALKV